MSDPTPEGYSPKRHYASKISDAVQSLDRELAEVIERAQTARDSMRRGNRPAADGFGVLSRAPMKVEEQNGRLAALLDLYRAVGLSPAEMEAAYAEGLSR